MHLSIKQHGIVHLSASCACDCPDIQFIDPGCRWKLGLFLDALRERQSSAGESPGATSEYDGPAQKLRSFFRANEQDSNKSSSTSTWAADEDGMNLLQSISTRIEMLSSEFSCLEGSATNNLRQDP